MTKRKGTFDVDIDVKELIGGISTYKEAEIKHEQIKEASEDYISVSKALKVIARQMKVSGNRTRTIDDYVRHVNHFQTVTKIQCVSNITADSIYHWLDSMLVSSQTKLTRLKCLKAFLSRCFDNGWIEVKFWKSINIKVDQKIKEGATEPEVNTLLSLLDLNDFVQLRDGVATLLMFRTGIRLNTLTQLEEKHIDTKESILNCICQLKCGSYAILGIRGI